MSQCWQMAVLYYLKKIGIQFGCGQIAVSFAFSVQNLMLAVAIGTGVGVNALISRRLG